MAEDELTTLEKLRSCWLLMILTLRLLVTITRTLTFSMVCMVVCNGQHGVTGPPKRCPEEPTRTSKTMAPQSPRSQKFRESPQTY